MEVVLNGEDKAISINCILLCFLNPGKRFKASVWSNLCVKLPQ